MQITAKKAREMVNNGGILLDVRSGLEYMFGHIEGSVNLPVQKIPNSIAKVVEDKTRDIIVYCASGSRSPIAVNLLEKAGYKHVYDLGAMANWRS